MGECTGTASRSLRTDPESKSQIALEHLSRVHISEPETAIFQVHAANQIRFRRCYDSVALKIPDSFREKHESLVGKLASDELTASINVRRLVVDWLNSVDSGPWLMIIDIADDSDTFFQVRSQIRSL